MQAAKEERDLVPTQVRVNTMAERLRQSPHYSPRDPTAAGDAAMGASFGTGRLGIGLEAVVQRLRKLEAMPRRQPRFSLL